MDKHYKKQSFGVKSFRKMKILKLNRKKTDIIILWYSIKFTETIRVSVHNEASILKGCLKDRSSPNNVSAVMGTL